MTRFAFVFCTLGFVYINLIIVISDISILHDMHCVEEFPKRVGIGGLGGVGNPRQKVSIA